MGEEYGPTGQQGGNIEDSPFFKPPKAVLLGGLLAFVPEGLTKAQYEEWLRRMTAANQTVMDFRGRLKAANGEVKIDVPVQKVNRDGIRPERVRMGVKVKRWIRNVLDGMCFSSKGSCCKLYTRIHCL